MRQAMRMTYGVDMLRGDKAAESIRGRAGLARILVLLAACFGIACLVIMQGQSPSPPSDGARSR